MDKNREANLLGRSSLVESPGLFSIWSRGTLLSSGLWLDGRPGGASGILQHKKTSLLEESTSPGLVWQWMCHIETWLMEMRIWSFIIVNYRKRRQTYCIRMSSMISCRHLQTPFHYLIVLLPCRIVVYFLTLKLFKVRSREELSRILQDFLRIHEKFYKSSSGIL